MNSSFSFSEVVFTGADRIVDTHCHYNLEPLYPEWQRHWHEAQAHGVVRSIIPGTEIETCRRAVEIAEQDENLQALVGIHPGSVAESERTLESTITELEALLQSEKVVGIGEIGLDYFRISPDDQAERSRQREWLTAQVELAKKYHAPVALHVRDRQVPEEPTEGNAYWDTWQIVNELDYADELVLHCVSGPLAYVQKMIEKGAFVSFAANVTYPNAHGIRELLKITPPDKILCETDAPFLPPQEFRGQVCEPWMIQKTAEFLGNRVQ